MGLNKIENYDSCMGIPDRVHKKFEWQNKLQICQTQRKDLVMFEIFERNLFEICEQLNQQIFLVI